MCTTHMVPMWKLGALLGIWWLRKSSVTANRWTAILEGQCMKCGACCQILPALPPPQLLLSYARDYRQCSKHMGGLAHATSTEDSWSLLYSTGAGSWESMGRHWRDRTLHCWLLDGTHWEMAVPQFTFSPFFTPSPPSFPHSLSFPFFPFLLCV